MRAFDGPRPCREARVYYYDLLWTDEAVVPLSVRQHVAACPFCREQMDRLRETLFTLERVPGRESGPEDETIAALTEQFQLLDERVTCSEARPCLPQLATAAPRIRIPTPVTVHVDHCPQCAADLATLRKLQLTADQLQRLSQLFASAPVAEVLPWPASGEGIAPVGPHRAPGREPPGRGTSGPGSVGEMGIACHEVSAGDVFDVVVPLGAPSGTRPRAVAAHLGACPACLGRARELHRTIRAIVERADSPIETVYHAAEDTEDASTRTPDTCQYPVSVEVVHAGSEAGWDPSDSRGIPSARMGGLRQSAASLARVVAVGVVIVALGALLRTTGPTASGTHVGEVRKAVEKAPNIHVVVTDHRAEPIQELLIARRTGRLVNWTPPECVLYHPDRGLKQANELGRGIGAPTAMSKTERDRARELMACCLLDMLRRLSSNAQLHPSQDHAGRETEKNLAVYELQHSQRVGNSHRRDRWWTYLDSATRLPQRVEFYRLGPSDPDWRLVTTTIYTYPDEQEMEALIRALLTAH